MLPPTHMHISTETSRHLEPVHGSLNKPITSRPHVEERLFSSRNLAGPQQEILMVRPSHRRQIKLLPKLEFSLARAINASSSVPSMTRGKHRVNTTWNSIGYNSQLKLD